MESPMERYTPLAAQVQAWKGSILFLEYFCIFGGAAKLRLPGGGAQRPVCHVNEPKKTGGRSARARTRGKNPLVNIYYCVIGSTTIIFSNVCFVFFSLF
jgi:hypothetical protein